MLIRQALGLLLAVALLGGRAHAGGVREVRVISALDGRPVGGVEVAWGGDRGTTDQEGRVRLEESGSPAGGSDLLVRASGAGFCDYTCPAEGGRGDGEARREVILIPGGDMDTPRYSSFLALFRSLTATGRIRDLLAADVTLMWRRSFHGTRVLRWASLPVDIAWDPAGPGTDRDRALFRRAMAEWERMTGLDLFQETDRPAAHLEVGFLGSASWTRFDAAGSGPETPHARLNVSPAGTENEVISWAEHELGHALFLLGHSRDPAHVMFEGGVSGQRVSEDEARVVRVLMALPLGEDVERYRWPPDEESSEEGSEAAVVVAAGFILLMILLAVEARVR